MLKQLGSRVSAFSWRRANCKKPSSVPQRRHLPASEATRLSKVLPSPRVVKVCDLKGMTEHEDFSLIIQPINPSPLNDIK